MDSETALQVALEDARERHRHLFELVMTADRQAMTLLSVYLTVSTAAIAGAATIMTSGSAHALAAWFLIGVTGCLFIGAYLCFLAMSSAEISAPALEPGFWIWAIENEGVTMRMAVEAYLRQMEEAQQKNRALNLLVATSLKRAKILGVAAPVVGLLLCAIVSANVEALV